MVGELLLLAFWPTRSFVLPGQDPCFRGVLHSSIRVGSL
jgi:hypothetical protein